MRIFLLRHGESLSNIDRSLGMTVADSAVPLSQKGMEQARRAGQRFYGYTSVRRLPLPQRVWVSPYKRTRQTAQLFLEGSPIPPTHGVREHINLVEQQFGLFDGVPDEQLQEQFPLEHAHYEKCVAHEGRFFARMPLGESRFDVAVRVHQAFGTFHRDAEKHGIKEILVVAHGATNRAFIMQWLHLPYEWFDKEPNPKNCSIRLLEDGKDRGYVYDGE